MSAAKASSWPQISCELHVGAQLLRPDDSHPPPELQFEDEQLEWFEQDSLGAQLVSHLGAQGAEQHAESRIRCSRLSVVETPTRIRRK
jgi:hypothetical protein